MGNQGHFIDQRTCFADKETNEQISLTVKCHDQVEIMIQDSKKTLNKLTSRQCNKSKIYKSQIKFDVNKYICKDCNAVKLNCPYSSSSVRLSAMRAHIKKQYPNVDLPRGL